MRLQVLALLLLSAFSFSQSAFASETKGCWYKDQTILTTCSSQGSYSSPEYCVGMIYFMHKQDRNIIGCSIAQTTVAKIENETVVGSERTSEISCGKESPLFGDYVISSTGRNDMVDILCPVEE